MFEPGDMVFNTIEKEIQLVIKVGVADWALTMAHDGETMWYAPWFLIEPTR